MANLRDLGYKIDILLKNAPESKETLCKKLHFSQNDLNKLRYGRLALNPAQIKTVASVFSVDPDSIVSYKNTDSYSNMVHCMSSFSTQEHCDEILDIIDSYIDIKEALS